MKPSCRLNSLRMPLAERLSVSRMRETRTYGSMRGGRCRPCVTCPLLSW
jgi:hypothetical protein